MSFGLSGRADDSQHPSRVNPNPHIVIGITNSQTCLVLAGRLRALKSAGFRVTLVSSPGPFLATTAKSEGVDFHELPMERGISFFRDLRALIQLTRLLLRLQPDVVEFSTPKAGLLGMIAARLAGVKYRVYLLRGLRLETAMGMKRVAMVAAERLTSYCAQVVLCSSRSLRQQALALRLAPEAKLQLLGNGSSHGVDTERFAPGPSSLRWRLGIPDRVPVIGFVGRLTRDKGIPELLQGFSKVLQEAPEARLLMVGWFDESEDALDASMRRQILEHPRIVCTGFVEDTAPYYRAMDFLILPSKREGFPNAVLEAAATGIPVITTFATGARNAVVAGVTGLLIPKGSVAAIRAACMELIRDRARRMRMGQEARAWVVEYFPERDVLGLTVAFYRNLLHAHPTADVWQTEPSEVAISMR